MLLLRRRWTFCVLKVLILLPLTFCANDVFVCQTECFLSVSEMSKRGSRWPPIRLRQHRQSALWCHIKTCRLWVSSQHQAAYHSKCTQQTAHFLRLVLGQPY